ncbi:MAG: hypothetical protein KKA79_02265, partial [Nanoarchaeota archaeon]|nr:hypothetical protein [Nanoarchaeota archaeon]
IYGMFIPFNPENLSYNDYFEYLCHEYKMLSDMASYLYSRYYHDCISYKGKFNKLIILYKKRKEWLADAFINGQSLFNWKGAPLLVFRGLKGNN